MVSVHLLDLCSWFLICPVIRLVSSFHRDSKSHLALLIRVPLLCSMTAEGHEFAPGTQMEKNMYLIPSA